MKVMSALDEQSVVAYAAAHANELNLIDATELVEAIAAARPDKLPEVAKIAAAGYRGRAYRQSIKWGIATASPDAYNAFPSAVTRKTLNVDGDASQKASQYFVIHGVQIFHKSNSDVATIEELLQKFGVEFFYGNGLTTLRRPLHECLNSRVSNPNAGSTYNAATAVEGTRTQLVDSGKAIVFEPRERIVVCPTDTRCQIGGFWLQDYAVAPPTNPAGATLDFDVWVIPFGKLYELTGK